MIMYNWNTNTVALKKKPKQFKIWQMEQSINFGLNGKKLDKKELKKNFSKLKLDPDRRRFIQLLLNEESSH